MDSRLLNNAVSSQSFSRMVVISFLIFEVTDEDDDGQYSMGIQGACFFGCILGWLIDILGIKRSDHIGIYIETAFVVVMSYATLLEINWSYISLAVFPVIAIGFIFALYRELKRQSGLLKQDDHGEEASAASGDDRQGEKGVTEGEALKSLVPYWALCMMGQLQADKFAVSKFLLFISVMLGVLNLMMTRLVLAGVVVAPGTGGVAPASVLLRRASLVVLLVAVHAVAAELLGEEALLFCLPEFAPVLLWFSVHLDRGGDSFITADKINLQAKNFGIIGAVIAAVLAAVMDESVLSWCTKTLVACVVSGVLIYYVVFMLRQWWSGQDGNAPPYLEEAVELLMFWANTLLIVAAMLIVSAFIAAVRLGMHEAMVAATVEFVNSSVARFL